MYLLAPVLENWAGLGDLRQVIYFLSASALYFKKNKYEDMFQDKDDGK